MSKHQKRLSVPNSWPVERKTDTFTVKAGAGPHGEDGVPLLILLRDVLAYVDNRKEARYALSNDAVIVNGDAINDEERPIGMFDIVAFPDRDEYYRVFPDEGGRLALTAIDAEAAESRLGKVEGKRQVTGGVTQLSLHDGTNVTVDDEATYGATDSIVVDNEDKEIVAHFPYEEGALVTAVRGNHAGKVGRIAEIEVTAGSGSNIVHVEPAAEAAADDPFETVEEYVVVIDENFVDDDAASASDEATVDTGSEDDDTGTEAADAESGETAETEDVSDDDTEDASADEADGGEDE
ncbi:30S ribosomal protein S4e [Halovivax limisalsi]|uniref:30S ribosomal protein S4e n=1 Tax=Halovivax limisalsi TaxID=1453760 RepID=UPI003CCCAAEC